MDRSEEICTRLTPSPKSLLPSPIRPIVNAPWAASRYSTPMPFVTTTTVAMTSAASILIAALTVLSLAVLAVTISSQVVVILIRFGRDEFVSVC